MNKITREQTEMVISCLGKMRVADICRKTGMPRGTVDRIINCHKKGLTQSYVRHEEAQRKRDYIMQNWGKKTTREIADALKYSTSVTLDVACSLGLITDEKKEEEKARFRAIKIEISRTEAVAKRKSATLIRKHKMERFRVMSGLPQETKWRVQMVPLQVRAAMARLVKRYNYFDLDEKYTLCYDSQTRRLPINRMFNEEYFTKKYGIEFVEGEDG